MNLTGDYRFNCTFRMNPTTVPKRNRPTGCSRKVTLQSIVPLIFLEEVNNACNQRAAGTSEQLTIKAWHDAMQDPILADAILDRLVHNAYKIELKGESMRGKRQPLDKNYLLRQTTFEQP